MLRDGVVDILEYQRRGRASACILQVIRSGSTRYDSHILDIDTLWTGVSLIVISSKAPRTPTNLRARIPLSTSASLIACLFHPDSTRRRKYDMRAARPSVFNERFSLIRHADSGSLFQISRRTSVFFRAPLFFPLVLIITPTTPL